MKKIIILFVAFVTLIISCKKDKSDASRFTGYSYVPDNIGHEVIYDVDSTIKNDFDGLWHYNHFQIRELIADTFTDIQGRPTLRLERYKRLTPNDNWVIYKVWTANKTSVHFEKKEDNLSFIKLVYPPLSTGEWNGNALNNLDALNYKFSSINVPATYNSFSFDSTLTVLQYDYRDFIDTVHYEERYATGVGMYYKVQDSINIESNGDPKSDTIYYRRLYTEKIVSFIK